MAVKVKTILLMLFCMAILAGCQAAFPLPYLGYAAAFILALFLFMALWNISLKRMVRRRTAELQRALDDLKLREQTLYELSITDPLTGFYNRTYFERKLDEFARAGKTGTGCVMCDLDGLKLINDTLGHAAGDDYIRQAAGILKRAFEGCDVVARIGGDEFGILVEHASEVLLENKKTAIGEMIDRANAGPRPIPISLSIGYALWDDAATTLPEILKRADDRMLRDKINHMQSIKSKNIEVLAHMLEARNFITEGRGERLVDLSRRLAEAAGLSAADVRDVMLLAKFHDLGKIGIPDTILFKPAALTDEETKVMRRHAEIGYRIAASSPDLRHIADWILKHHERYDGTGYPFGLKGTEIPVQCRIVAILDAFDAMTNDRPYRKAAPLSHALEELVRHAGTQFDPHLVREFCRIAKRAEACAS
jgi:diguanylate cyclase (GGDEF)-like protein